jgi:hypothetical protein
MCCWKCFFIFISAKLFSASAGERSTRQKSGSYSFWGGGKQNELFGNLLGDFQAGLPIQIDVNLDFWPLLLLFDLTPPFTGR